MSVKYLVQVPLCGKVTSVNITNTQNSPEKTLVTGENVCSKHTENMVKKGIYSDFSIVIATSAGDYNFKQIFKQVFISEKNW